ncbi:MAG: N-acetylgalactosamine 6-sulfate sulfatase, partial [Verrucomicrobiaceae bacterium]
QQTIQAIRFGDWKAVRNGPKVPVELYDLKADAGETHDLAAQKPELVQKAISMMAAARVDDPNWPVREKGAGKKNAQKK